MALVLLKLSFCVYIYAQMSQFLWLSSAPNIVNLNICVSFNLNDLKVESYVCWLLVVRVSLESFG